MRSVFFLFSSTSFDSYSAYLVWHWHYGALQNTHKHKSRLVVVYNQSDFMFMRVYTLKKKIAGKEKSPWYGEIHEHTIYLVKRSTLYRASSDRSRFHCRSAAIRRSMSSVIIGFLRARSSVGFSMVCASCCPFLPVFPAAGGTLRSSFGSGGGGSGEDSSWASSSKRSTT